MTLPTEGLRARLFQIFYTATSKRVGTGLSFARLVGGEQPFSVKTDGENPDILTHCGHDSNSQASNSPDVCQDYEVKAETEQHIDAGLGPRGSQ